jgi:urease accessory protein
MKRLIILIILMSAGSASAHPGHGAGGFAYGLIHPLLGLDHWLAMLGLGLWSCAAALPRRALATVCMGLAAGAFAPLALPAVEPLLAASVLVAGLIALGWLAGRNARLRKLAPALVTLAGAGLLGLA